MVILIFLLLMFSFISILVMSGSVLSVLISMEMIIVSLFVLILKEFCSESVLGLLFFMVVSVGESVLGLILLLLKVNFTGNDFLIKENLFDSF